MSDVPEGRAADAPPPDAESQEIARLVHEINNVVGGILVAAQYAVSAHDRADFPALAHKALADIAADAERCRGLVRDLRRLARPGADPPS